MIPLLLLAALVLAGLGHYYSLQLHAHLEGVVAFYGLAALLALWGYAQAESMPRLVVIRASWRRIWRILSRLSIQINRPAVGALLATNVLAVLVALCWPSGRPWGVWLLWVGGTVLLIFLSLGTSEARAGPGERRRWLGERVAALLSHVKAIYVLPLVLLCAGASQFAFERGEIGRSWGILLFLASFPVVWLFAYLEGRQVRDATRVQELDGGPRSSLYDVLLACRVRLILGASAIVATAVAAVLTADDEGSLIAGGVWLIGVGLFLMACLPPMSKARWCGALTGWQEFLHRHWLEVILAFLVLAAGAFVRFYGLSHFYGVVEQDEGQFGSEALRILQGERPNLFGVAWLFNHTAIFSYLTAGSMRLLGQNIVGLRMLPAFMGWLSLVFVYVWVRRAWGVPAALIAVSLLAVAPHHLLSSRMGIHDMVVLLLFVPAVSYFLYRALLSRRSFDYALAGVSLGLGLWLDYNNKAMILLPIVGCIAVFLFVTQWKYWRSEYFKVGLFCLGTLIVLLPVWAALARMDRLWLGNNGFFKDKFILQAPHLTVAQQQYGTSDTFQVLLRQVERNVFSVNYYHDVSFLSNYAGWLSRRPVLNGVVAVFFLVGLAYSVWHWREPRYAFLLIAWVLGMQGGIWSESPPQIHRLVAPILMPVCVMAALGLVKMAGVLLGSVGLHKTGKMILLVVIVGTVLGYAAYIDLSTYFSLQSVTLAWEEQPLPDNLSWVGLSRTGEMIEGLSRDHRVYYLGAPLVYANGHGTILFHSNLASLSVTDVEDIDTVVPLREAPLRDIVFVVAPGHFADLEKLQRCYSEGRLQEWRDERVDGVCFKTFWIAREQANHPAADCR